MRIIAQIDAEISYIVVVCNSYFVPYFTKKKRKYNIILIYVHLLFFLSVFLPTQQQLGFLSLDISCLGSVEHDLLYPIEFYFSLEKCSFK